MGVLNNTIIIILEKIVRIVLLYPSSPATKVKNVTKLLILTTVIFPEFLK